MKKRTLLRSSMLLVFIMILGIRGNVKARNQLFTHLSNELIYLPLVLRNWPPHPIPNISPINNQDQDNYYTVTWQNTGDDDNYILEESMNASFSNTKQVYQGPNLNWTVPVPGKLPGTYYYRAKAAYAYGESTWSETRSVTIFPLFVGLKLRWDGVGYIRGSEYYEVGTHDERVLDIITEPDTVRANNHYWYAPNPQGWEDDYWYSYYSVTTGLWKGSSTPGDPAWKWGYSLILGYYSQFVNGETVTIDGQNFTVTGPHSGVTVWGRSIQYWKFVNQNNILYWDGGGDWKQYVHPGDVVLHYDAGNSRLLLFSSILRHYYYQGAVTSDTVQYVDNLTSSNSLPNSLLLYTFIDFQKEIFDNSEKEFVQPTKGANKNIIIK